MRDDEKDDYSDPWDEAREAGKPDEKDADELRTELAAYKVALASERLDSHRQRWMHFWAFLGMFASLCVMMWTSTTATRNSRAALLKEMDAHNREINAHNETLVKYRDTLERCRDLDIEAQVYCDELELTKRGVEFQRIPGRLKLDRKPFQHSGEWPLPNHQQRKPGMVPPARKVD